jgi:VanZ family protein
MTMSEHHNTSPSKDTADDRPGEVPKEIAQTGTRLAVALLIYILAVVLFVTLIPFDFEWPAQWRVLVMGDALDIVANVLLFVPLGFLLRLALRQRGSALPILSAAALISVAIEGAQLFEMTRDSTVTDVIANAAGAWIGALACGRIARSARLTGRAIGWLGLELPLMALVYLLVPLLWASSLASAGEWLRMGTTLLLAVFGASVLGGVQRHYFGPAGSSSAGKTAIFGAIWFMAGAFPYLTSQPQVFALGAVVAGAVCWWQGRRSVELPGTTRRFEVPLLRATTPLFAAYLAFIIVAPVMSGAGAWSLSIGFPSGASQQIQILRVLELLAAFTLMGYMVAEFRGRTLVGYRDALPRILGYANALAIATELARGFEPGQGASIARGVLLIAATLYGGWLYYLQRAHVVKLLSEAGARPTTP